MKILMASILAVLIFGAAQIGNKREPRTIDLGQQALDHRKDLEWKGQQLIVAKLREPSSAVFGPSYVTDTGILCGTVNARNGFGGMTGLKGYVVTSTKVAIEGHPGFIKLWNSSCVRRQDT